VRAWIDAHETPIMVSGGVGIAGLALYVRHRRTSAAAGTDAAGAAAAGVTPNIAGLSGAPDTSSTDLQNELQDEINSQFGTLQQQLTDAIAKLPKAPTPTPPPKPAPPAAKPPPTPAKPAPPKPTPATKTYTVVHGDNLSKIAAAHGITLAQIEKLNPQIKNFNLIYAGQKVNI